MPCAKRRRRPSVRRPCQFAAGEPASPHGRRRVADETSPAAEQAWLHAAEGRAARLPFEHTPQPARQRRRSIPTAHRAKPSGAPDRDDGSWSCEDYPQRRLRYSSSVAATSECLSRDRVVGGLRSGGSASAIGGATVRAFSRREGLSLAACRRSRKTNGGTSSSPFSGTSMRCHHCHPMDSPRSLNQIFLIVRSLVSSCQRP
jgi:hypothetical protein